MRFLPLVLLLAVVIVHDARAEPVVIDVMETAGDEIYAPRDVEGIAAVPTNESLWLADDGGKAIFEMGLLDGEIRQVIRSSDLAAAFPEATTCEEGDVPGCSRLNEFEALAYDPYRDELLLINTVNDFFLDPAVDVPALYRMTRDGPSEAFAPASWNPLPRDCRYGSAIVIDTELFIGCARTLRRYDPTTQTLGDIVIPAEGQPRTRASLTGLAFDGESLWVLASRSDEVDTAMLHRYEWATKKELESFDLEALIPGLSKPKGLTMIGKHLYVSDGSVPHPIHVLLDHRAEGGVIHVPRDFESIQDAVDEADDGDMVLVAPGLYEEQVLISESPITLASYLDSSGIAAYRDQTIIDGEGEKFALTIGRTSKPGTTVVGFTIRNADDGVIGAGVPFDFIHNRVTNTGDGLDYEDGGGLVRNCLFDHNSDDGIDLDGGVTAVIESSTIRDNGDDGIEIRLHPTHDDHHWDIDIRDNVISGNREDGIQLIDNATDGTGRTFRIERNLITDNEQAGIGMMCCMTTIENYEGTDMIERVFVTNNTFAGNDVGLTGGLNTIVLNNIFVDTTGVAILHVKGDSIAAYNAFHGNGSDYSDSVIDEASSSTEAPMLEPDFSPGPDSPVIDAGVARFEWASEVVLDLPPDAYRRSAPDLGAREFLPEADTLALQGVVAAILCGLLNRRRSRGG